MEVDQKNLNSSTHNAGMALSVSLYIIIIMPDTFQGSAQHSKTYIIPLT